jgi:acyl-CoA reductase-like NAD-dependent aldehyde dehydrogenase
VPVGGEYLWTLDPATREAGPQVARGGLADVDGAVAVARAAQPGWGALSGAARSEFLHRVAAAIEGNSDDLVKVERVSTGKVEQQLRLEIDMSAAYFRYYAGVLLRPPSPAPNRA